MQPLQLRGARTHHLQGVDLDLHPGELVVLTGVSGGRPRNPYAQCSMNMFSVRHEKQKCSNRRTLFTRRVR